MYNWITRWMFSTNDEDMSTLYMEFKMFVKFYLWLNKMTGFSYNKTFMKMNLTLFLGIFSVNSNSKKMFGFSLKIFIMNFYKYFKFTSMFNSSINKCFFMTPTLKWISSYHINNTFNLYLNKLPTWKMVY